jgi:DNA-binding winged helix-turn-helix (wHTH) protein/tetratricopeptide (TPR) repeat protein
MAVEEVYEIGVFVLDVTERRLSGSGADIALPPKAFDLLVALVRRAGTLVSKRELLDVVWPATSVEEGIISVHVSALRKILGATVDGSHCIETVPRSGYRFTGTAARRPPVRGAGVSIFSIFPPGILPARAAVSDFIGTGRTHLLTASRAAVPKAIEAFRSAIELDPGYASAHAGLALACCAQAELRIVAPGEAYTEARAASLRALAMDSSNPDAQVALGTVLFLSDWNWSGARKSLERALQVDADHSEGWLLYGRLLDALGQTDQGLAAKQKALERNPSATVHLQIALSLWHQRRYDEMIEWANRALALDPQHLLAREFVAGAYLKKGEFDRHMAETIAHAEAAGAPTALIREMEDVAALGGRAAVVQWVLRRNSPMPPMQLALLHGEVGNVDEAFRQLSIALAARDPALVNLAVGPQWDHLRGDPRFGDALRVMGLRQKLQTPNFELQKGRNRLS